MNEKEEYIKNLDKEIDEKELFLSYIKMNIPISFEKKEEEEGASEPIVLALDFLHKHKNKEFTENEWWYLIKKTNFQKIGRHIFAVTSVQDRVKFNQEQWRCILENTNLDTTNFFKNNVLTHIAVYQGSEIINKNWDIFYKKSNLFHKDKYEYTVLYYLVSQYLNVEEKVFTDIKNMNNIQNIHNTVISFYTNIYRLNQSNKEKALKKFSFFVDKYFEQIPQKSIDFLVKKKAKELLNIIKVYQNYDQLQKGLQKKKTNIKGHKI
jgi:hypothetical protein